MDIKYNQDNDQHQDQNKFQNQNASQNKKIYKVSQINAAARLILEANFATVWIEGEISNLSQPHSGHIYFSLKDEMAQVRCAMFRQYNGALNFAPKNGMQVVVRAKISLYEPRGDFQLIVEHMEPQGAGILHEKFLQLKAKLLKEGLFDTKYKKPLPTLPNCIGIITSPTGAAIRDIISVSKRRFSAIPLIIYPTQVQGQEAAKQIVAALEIANSRQECDLLILARGGGSIEDLWPFNEEIVARAIFASKIPTISAVGHEIDFTIADFVADRRAPTPSAAAELAVPDQAEWLAGITQLGKRLVGFMQHKLQECIWLFKTAQSRLHHPRHYLEQQAQRIDDLERRLQFAVTKKLNSYQDNLGNLALALDLVSPLATLKRGFAIVTKGEHVLSKISASKVADKISVRLVDGILDCRVEEIKNT
ncbi:MAG: exodeoxyribonuclease VII large subunit [Gammaproteobacteria bacterium]|nr:exodeoxyribonuclease VII large subunit [Gammaproteobacteria bacterium]